MNPHTAHSISPRALLRSLRVHRDLMHNLIRREVVGRYRGSVLGLLWSFFNPVLMLATYTFVFSVVFKARWLAGSDSRTEFALVLFAGLMLYNFFAECVTRAPGVILTNTNYVKKVVFPLEILPVVIMGSAFFHFLVSLLVWLIFYLIFFGLPPPSGVLLVILLFPFILMTLGLSWFLASIGVYLRDVSQVITLATSALMFLSPIFYPITALPEDYRWLLQINPLTFIIEQARDVMIWGNGPDWSGLALYTLLAAMIAWGGFAWFQKTRKGFADVL